MANSVKINTNIINTAFEINVPYIIYLHNYLSVK